MPEYVIVADHRPDHCPIANASVRALVLDGMKNRLPAFGPSSGVTFKVAPVHLDPGHRTVAIVEAGSMDDVIGLVGALGLTQWNDVEVSLATPTAELFGNLEGTPALFS